MRLGFEGDPKLEDEGEWKDFPELQPKLRVKLRSTRSKHYKRLVARRQFEARGLRRAGPVKASEVGELIAGECIAEAIVLDWEGMFDYDSKPPAPVPYSPEMAKRLMTERQFAAFADAITIAATRIGQAEEQLDEEDVQD